jgi:hypothetical protein
MSDVPQVRTCLPDVSGWCTGALTIVCMLQVLAGVFGPRAADIRSQALSDRAQIKCECAHAAFSTGAPALSAAGKLAEAAPGLHWLGVRPGCPSGTTLCLASLHILLARSAAQLSARCLCS